MADKKYLDSTGVGKLVDLIKGKIQTGSSSLIQVAAATGSNNKVSIAANSTLDSALSTLVTSLDKAHKDIENATGDLSGNYYDKDTVDDLIANAIDGVFDFQGNWPLVSGAKLNVTVGSAYLVSEAATNISTLGITTPVEAGDMIICTSTAGNNGNGTWHVVQNNWHVETTVQDFGQGGEKEIAKVGGTSIKVKLTPATSVASGNSSVVTSGAVHSAIESAKSSLTGTGTSSYTTIKGVGDALETHKSAYTNKMTALDNEDKAIRTAFANADTALKNELVGTDGYASLTAAKSAVVALSGTVSSNYNTLDAKINGVNSNIGSLSEAEVTTAFNSKWA